ncbi:protoheme IX farnesyltransferase [Klebsiella aerogenes]|nr:protoheme IX farnesyltransferase [Klebsiella aerogenes]
MVASGCVFNNYIDRDIDRKMERTKNRVLVKGLISPEASLVYATLLGMLASCCCGSAQIRWPAGWG